ncbi:MAG: PAS domain-containing sensor histidine kinase [Lachnospiraceae bacterium]|nr:PAS domain-containing sensor histidine kinase [Lachnospiraceae bacterium]
MSSKIFSAILTVAVSVFLVSLFFIMGISYNYFTTLQKRQLKNETELAAQGVSVSGIDYFNNLNTENYRITWIDSDGNVIYDNEADSKTMTNHLEREEVQEALKTGYGEAYRYSSTLEDRQLYAAKRLEDGTVLRLSIVQMAVWTLLLGLAQPICVVVVIALVLSFILSSRIAKKIVKPINEIDLNHPEEYYGKDNYKEIEPLLRHISMQMMQHKEDQARIEKTALIRQEFSANVSHELKTPLHAISGYAELIENGLVKEEDIKPFAGKIRVESSRMTKLVEDIIDLTNLDNGGKEMQWEESDFYKITENAIDSLEDVARKADVKVSLEGESTVMWAAPQMLYSIAYNLCHNAIKYNKPGGSVRVSVNQTRYNTILKVQDTGIGIPDESKARIFERFYRVDKSRSKAVGGTGLGLSIVKHAVMIHNGQIEINSKINEGTEFIVTLPNQQGEPEI